MVQLIVLAELEVISQTTPSILTESVLPKLVPVITKFVPPILGPNLGLTPVTVEVDE